MIAKSLLITSFSSNKNDWIKKKKKLLTSSSNLWLFKEYLIYSIFAIFVIQKVQIKLYTHLRKTAFHPDSAPTHFLSERP